MSKFEYVDKMYPFLLLYGIFGGRGKRGWSSMQHVFVYRHVFQVCWLQKLHFSWFVYHHNAWQRSFKCLDFIVRCNIKDPVFWVFMLTYWRKTFPFLCSGFKIKEENYFTTVTGKLSTIPLTDSRFIENNGQRNFLCFQLMA